VWMHFYTITPCGWSSDALNKGLQLYKRLCYSSQFLNSL
jgi:hypothetical protein